MVFEGLSFGVKIKLADTSFTKLSIPYSSQQVGVVLTMNHTFMEIVRSMLYYSGMPLNFCAEAMPISANLKVEVQLYN